MCLELNSCETRRNRNFCSTKITHSNPWQWKHPWQQRLVVIMWIDDGRYRNLLCFPSKPNKMNICHKSIVCISGKWLIGTWRREGWRERESEQEREQVRERERGNRDRKTELALKSLVSYWAFNNLFTTVTINFVVVLNPQYTCQHLWVLGVRFCKWIESTTTLLIRKFYNFLKK